MSYIYAYVFTDDVYRVFIEKKRERERQGRDKQQGKERDFNNDKKNVT